MTNNSERMYIKANQERYKGGNLFDAIKDAPMMDVSKGGQNGFRHKIGGIDDKKNVVELHSDTKYTSTQVIPVLIQVPKGFELFQNHESWIDSLKHIVEVRPESITGLKGTLTVNFTENTVSGAGEIYSQPVNVLRERTVVEFTWKDIVGRPIQKLLIAWIEYLMMDPDTKVPKMNKVGNYVTDSWTTDYQTMTMLFIEMDVAHRYVDKAWLVTAMMPTTSGPIEARRNYQEDATILELVIPFTGVAESTQEVVLLAESIISTMTYIRSDTDFQPLSVKGRGINVRESESETGFNQPWLDDGEEIWSQDEDFSSPNNEPGLNTPGIGVGAEGHPYN